MPLPKLRLPRQRARIPKPTGHQVLLPLRPITVRNTAFLRHWLHLLSIDLVINSNNHINKMMLFICHPTVDIHINNIDGLHQHPHLLFIIQLQNVLLHVPWQPLHPNILIIIILMHIQIHEPIHLHLLILSRSSKEKRIYFTSLYNFTTSSISKQQHQNKTSLTLLILLLQQQSTIINLYIFQQQQQQTIFYIFSFCKRRAALILVSFFFLLLFLHTLVMH